MQVDVEVAPTSPYSAPTYSTVPSSLTSDTTRNQSRQTLQAPSPPPLLHSLGSPSEENSAPPSQTLEHDDSESLSTAEPSDIVPTTTIIDTKMASPASQASPAIPSVVDVLKAKGSARARLLNERRELLMKKGDGDTLQRRGKETKKKASVRRSLLARTGKSPLKRSQSSALRTMR